MDYLSWRATYQDAEQAAQRAFESAERYREIAHSLRRSIEAIRTELARQFEDKEEWQRQDETAEADMIRLLVNALIDAHESNITLTRRKKIIKKKAYEQAAELQEREAEVRQLRQELSVPRSDQSPINLDFGLTRASWLVAPRVILEAMPLHWQKRLSRLGEELDARFDWNPDHLEFHVQAKKDGRFVSIPNELCNYRHPDRNWLESIDRSKQLAGQKREPVHG